MSNNFLVPLVLNHKSNALIYGEEGPQLLFKYEFEDVSGVISVSQMRDTFKYKDNGDDNGIILKYDIGSVNSITSDDWHDLITNQVLKTTNKYRNSYTLPSDGLFSAHVIQWISSTLFGHPLAQAPITNEATIISDISGGTGYSGNVKLGQQIFDSLTHDISGNNGGNNEIVQSIYEQMVNIGRFNDGQGDATVDLDGTTEYSAPPDTNGFIPFPFRTGDKLSFLIKVECELGNDTADIEDNNGVWDSTTNSNLSNLFNGINGIISDTNGSRLDPEVWKFTFVAN
jgi:hypothetical protein